MNVKAALKMDDEQLESTEKKDVTMAKPSTENAATAVDGKAPQNEAIKHEAHDSMVTVRLSEPPSTLQINTTLPQQARSSDLQTQRSSTAASGPSEGDETPSAECTEESPRITMIDTDGNEVESPADHISQSPRPASEGSVESVEEEQVDWEELEKSEGQEPKDQWTDDVSIFVKTFQIFVRRHANGSFCKHSLRLFRSHDWNRRTIFWPRIQNRVSQEYKMRTRRRRGCPDPLLCSS